MNPFQAPTEEAPVFEGFTSEWYERLARRRRRLVLSYLALLGVLVGSISVASTADGPPGESPDDVATVVVWVLAVMVLWTTAQVHVFLVLKMISGAASAALTVLFLGLPLGGIIAVVIATRRATGVLKRAGYQVGFLAASRRRAQTVGEGP